MLRREPYPKPLHAGINPHHSPLSPSPQQQILPDQWVDKYAIMKEFNLSERTLYNLRKNKELPFARLGKLILYNRTQLELRLRKLSGMMLIVLHLLCVPGVEFDFL